MDNTNYLIYTPTKSAYQYLLNPSQVNQFCGELADGTITGFDITGLFQDTNDYVVSINYYPVNLSLFCNTNNTSSNIILGKVTTDVTGFDVTKQLPYYYMGDFTLARYHNNFLDFAPYTKITLSIPYFDKIDINPNMIYGKTLSLYMSLDLLSGKASVYLVDKYSFNLIASSTAQLGITIPLGKTNEQEQTRNNILQGINLVGSIGSLVYGAGSGNGLAIAGGLALATRTTTTMLQNNTDQLKGYTGMQGSRDGLCVEKKIQLIVERPKIVSQPDASVIGKPYMKTNIISNIHTGFIRVQLINFNPKNNNIYQDEIQEIVSLLKDGVIL